MRPKAAPAVVGLGLILNANLAAGMMDPDPDTSLFDPPQIEGFEEFPVSPVLFAQPPILSGQSSGAIELLQPASSSDWSPSLEVFLQATPFHEARWRGDEWVQEEQEAPVSTLKVVLGGSPQFWGWP